MKRTSTPLARAITLTSAAVLAGALALTAAPAASAAPYCGITWGSTPEQASRTSTDPLTGVRSGRHTCYDRLVLGVAGQAAGYDVRYVDQVRSDGSGAVVPLRGGADLQLVVHVPAYDAHGDPTYTPRNRAELADVVGYTTFRQVAWAGSFEGSTTIGLGTRARLPFRVFVLDGPGGGSRVVVDVAHRW